LINRTLEEQLNEEITLESESKIIIEWFRVNKMQANPDKFQVLAVGKKTYDKNPSIHIQNSDLTCEKTVKLLGIETIKV
jgi:kynurenine formamidase